MSQLGTGKSQHCPSGDFNRESPNFSRSTISYELAISSASDMSLIPVVLDMFSSDPHEVESSARAIRSVAVLLIKETVRFRRCISGSKEILVG